jgi:hypothetical protein
MRTGTTHDLPARLESTRRRFERWRQARDGRSHIPEALWASAVKAVGKYGLNPTARALRLDYYSLKKHVEAAASCDGSDRREVAQSAAGKSAASEICRGGIRRGTFIELAPVASACSPECILEFEHPDGAKMRVHLTGMQAPDLAALSRSFWGMET